MLIVTCTYSKRRPPLQRFTSLLLIAALLLLPPARNKVSAAASHGQQSAASLSARPTGLRRLQQAVIEVDDDSYEDAITGFLKPNITARLRQEAEEEQQMPGRHLPGRRKARRHRPPAVYPAPKRRVWLYSLISADYDGAALLTHWLQHYLALGIPREGFLLVVNFNPANRGAQSADLDAVQDVLQREGFSHRLWYGQYSSESHLKLKLRVLHEAVTDPQDWIVIADSDEFQLYALPNLPAFLSMAEARGATWVRGFLQDRVSASGQLSKIAASPSLFKQFPRHCHVLRATSKGKRKKVAAFKAFLRSNQGNHEIIWPEDARWYFGASSPGDLSPRGGYAGGEDLFGLTPYFEHHAKYFYPSTADTPRNAHLWSPVMTEFFGLIQHFKWHAGVIRSAADRLAFYKGDYDAAQGKGLPRYQHYVESERIMEAVVTRGGVDLSSVDCENVTTNPKYLTEQQRLHWH